MLTLQLTHAERVELTEAVEHIDNVSSGQGPELTAKWLFSVTQRERLQFVKAAIRLAKFVKEEITEV
jgi:hypothetical protein